MKRQKNFWEQWETNNAIHILLQVKGFIVEEGEVFQQRVTERTPQEVEK